MLKKLTVNNFRSIEACGVEFAPITIFFGPTAAGKSTLLYALLVLKNFISSPNQSADGLFNLGFQNLGGFDACIFNHQSSKSLSITADFGEQKVYTLALRKNDADIMAGSNSLPVMAKIPIPYAANQSWAFPYTEKEDEYAVNWNGFAATVSPKVANTDTQARAIKLAEALNAAAEAVKRLDICPHRRGFFKPSYSAAPLPSIPWTEDEVATLLINDQNSPPRISINTVEIFDRDFRTHTPPGTATTFFQTTEQKGARVPGLLVNDGFGVNQVVYMLAKIHRPDVETILIEEPEVHLHPSVIRKFARVLAQLVNEEGKQLVFTTHSEQFILSILACVNEGMLSSDHLHCYHVSRERKQTQFRLEPVSKDGRISGGLASFMEGELEDIKSFLSVPK